MRDLYGCAYMYVCKHCCNLCGDQRVYLCARAQTPYFQVNMVDNALKTVKID